MLTREGGYRLVYTVAGPLILEVPSRAGHPCQVPLEPDHPALFEAHGLEERKRHPVESGRTIHTRPF